MWHQSVPLFSISDFDVEVNVVGLWIWKHRHVSVLISTELGKTPVVPPSPSSETPSL